MLLKTIVVLLLIANIIALGTAFLRNDARYG